MKHLPSLTVDPLKKWATFKDPFHIPLKQPGLPKTEPQRTLRSVAALTWKAYEEIVHSFTAHFFRVSAERFPWNFSVLNSFFKRKRSFFKIKDVNKTNKTKKGIKRTTWHDISNQKKPKNYVILWIFFSSKASRLVPFNSWKGNARLVEKVEKVDKCRSKKKCWLLNLRSTVHVILSMYFLRNSNLTQVFWFPAPGHVVGMSS